MDSILRNVRNNFEDINFKRWDLTFGLMNVRYNCNTKVNFIGYDITLGLHFKECKATNFEECDLAF